MTKIRDLQAQYYYGTAKALQDASTPLAAHLRKRAARVWMDQSIVSIGLEMDDQRGQAVAPRVPGPRPILDCVIDSLAATSDLAHRPSLLGEELVSVLKTVGCSPGVAMVKTRAGMSPPADTQAQAVLRLGADQRHMLCLVCPIPADPVKAILLADVLRIGRAALELDRARQAERNRAAIWPAMPIEEQTGALFVADEMRQHLATVRRIAPTPVPVLITGETGTGKEVLARTIHLYSTRATATFAPFNCNGVPKDMLDSQLFGHRKGAFTGATEHFPGIIRAAHGGTLFLDEIGDLPLDVQPKLLRFLENHEVHPIGEVRPVPTDIRLIAATNADLDALVSEGRFREDLLYRLNVFCIHLPALRERRVEIPILASHYLRKYALEHRKGDLRLAEETMEYLLLYRWPGNVRQLANEMRRLAALAEPGAVLMPEHLSDVIAASRRTLPASERVLTPNEMVVRTDQTMAASVQHVERTMVQRALSACEGRVADAAAMLGISRKGLYLKRLRYGLAASGTGTCTP
jgi:DNA-binding NtrC family response regulator